MFPAEFKLTQAHGLWRALGGIVSVIWGVLHRGANWLERTDN
jgi:hypothetical protein